MVDYSTMKLGRGLVKRDIRTLKLGNYLKKSLPPAPVATDWTTGVQNWGMMLNDQYGDCTIAAAAHAIQVWTAHAGTQVTLPDATILEYFEKWDGYDPKNPTSDHGGSELNVLNQWRKDALGSHKLIAFADPAYDNLDEIRQAITLFGGVYIGVELPITAQTQDIWDVVPNGGANAKSGSWGGHAVFVPKYDATSFTCVTWGQLKQMTVAFWNAYVDEAHALLSTDWFAAKGSPSGFALAELKADLALIK